MSDVHPWPKRPRRPKAPRELVRKTALAKSNPERRAALYARNFGEWADEIRAMPCWGCGTTREKIDAAHTVARGMGGCGGDKRTLLPLCADNIATQRIGCHTRFDRYVLERDGVVVTREMAYEAALALWLERGPREDAA